MSTDDEHDVAFEVTSPAAYHDPELSEVGRRIEAHRTRRRLTKGQLARQVGVSRQQLWRVMTGKSTLTAQLRERLATALDARDLLTFDRAIDVRSAPTAVRSAPNHTAQLRVASDLVRYLSDVNAIVRTLETLPTGSEGRWLYRAVFDVIEEMAAISGVELSADVVRLRRGLPGDRSTDAAPPPVVREAPRSA